MYRKRKSFRKGHSRRGKSSKLSRSVSFLLKAQIKAAFGQGRNHLVHQLEKSYQDLEVQKMFFIPAYYHAANYEGEALPDFVPNSAWQELAIGHRSRVKSVWTKIEIFSTSDYAAQLKWCPVYLGEYDIRRFPQSLIDGLEVSETLNDLQDDEATRWLVKKQYDMYFQPRQMRTMTKHWKPTRGKPRDIQSGMIAGILIENANVKAGSFDFKIKTAFSEYVRDPDTYELDEDKQYGGDAMTDVGE